jgi:hypothetical protein
MKKQLLILATLVTINTSISLAQKSFMKYGEIPEEDMNMTIYPEDTTAEAVILGEFGITSFNISEDEGFF